MAANWPTTELTTSQQVFDTLARLQGEQWICRGQSHAWGMLTPSIDRVSNGTRAEKLQLEREAIDLFRSMTFSFGRGEEGARDDDVVALCVLRHFGVPTRLLDWSDSPYVATYFAACDRPEEDAELWAFDRRRYEVVGKLQWEAHTETTLNWTGHDTDFRAQLTAFTVDAEYDWFCCTWYPQGFPRQKQQHGLYL